MFGHCDECIYCRCVKKPLGSFHVCARNAPVQSTDRSHEQATFPIVQLYDKDECLSGCGEFHPDYELIKQRAFNDAKTDSEKIVEEARKEAREKIEDAYTDAKRIIADAREKALKSGETAIEQQVKSIIEYSASYVANGGTKSALRNLVTKSLESGGYSALKTPYGFRLECKDVVKTIAYEVIKTYAESIGVKIIIGGCDEGEILRIKAVQKGYQIQKSLIKKGE